MTESDPLPSHIVDQLIEERAVRLSANPRLWPWVKRIFYPLLGYRRACEIADALADALGVHHSLAALCHTRGGRYTALAPRRHPYGPTKIDAAHALAADADLPLSQAIAFGDSINDAYLFRVVGEAVAVQPDRRLSEAASGAGWEVLLDRVDRA